jgi:hypothetical protein
LFRSFQNHSLALAGRVTHHRAIAFAAGAKMSTLSSRLAYRAPQTKHHLAVVLLAVAVALAAAVLAPGLADICAQDGLLVCGP